MLNNLHHLTHHQHNNATTINKNNQITVNDGNGLQIVCPNNNPHHQYAATIQTNHQRHHLHHQNSSITSITTTTPTSDNNGNNDASFATNANAAAASSSSATTSNTCNIQLAQQNGNGFRIIENPLPAGACEATRISSMFENY